MSRAKKIFILAGEASGDLHAGRLLNELKKLMPDTVFSGIGGEAMKNAGLNSIIDMRKISVVGIWEVARNFNFFRNVFDLCKKKLADEKYDLFIPVDFPGFNIKLANYARKHGIPVIYFIAPQLWAWGKKRAKKLASAVDLLLVVLPFEKDFFSSIGIDAYFIGHPLLDDPLFSGKIKTYDEREKLIAFFPGSRKQELKRHSELIVESAIKLHKIFPDYKMALAKTKELDLYYKKYFKVTNIKWEVFEDSKELLSIAKAGVIKTGTSTLESALLGMPFLMFYKTSFISYYAGKKLINLPYISLPNILLKKPLIKELFQKDANPQSIASEITRILTHRNYYENLQSEFSKLKSLLGEKGASERAARIIHEFLNAE